MELNKTAFENWLRLKNLKPRTIEAYIYYLDKLKFKPLFNQEAVNEFLQQYNQVIARAFVHNYQQFIFDNKKLLDMPKEEIETIIDIHIPKTTGREKKRIPQVISKLEVFALADAMTSERNKLMVLITFYGGLRLGGLLGIKPYDFQWKKWNLDKTKPCELKVIEKGDKERTVLIPAKLTGRILNWIKNVASKRNPDPSKPIFKMNSRTWQQYITNASEKGLGFRIHPHTLRHSSATNLLDNGWDIKEIQEYLGHADIKDTAKYLHINKDKLKEKFESI